MPVEFDHERTTEYRAALALHNHLIQGLPARRGFGVTRSQIERQLVLTLVRVADAMARPESDSFLRQLEKADSSCVRVVALLQSLMDRRYVENTVLEKGRELVEALRTLLRRHFLEPVPAAPDSGADATERGVGGRATVPTNGFRPNARAASRPQRRARMQ
jgi:23S rRNA-intervening sequence protein